ncbi:FmdE family protein [Nitratiruptor sp. SB155-2]|uniref:FmdE family protein n=1 Tax=Nitratiruptor sp. (strain SB155-2) TaxID=387092 RepID=UPI0001587168|nr:FmdE family protein [Nitratiruptor sp. SB155-2]BAF70914.1 conserved hypothetical protein [Nitratiruptor sp. SB155-2]
MEYPKFFDQVESITMYDPLSDFLGAFENGLVDIHYKDIALFAGHSCPTVAGCYLMAKIGLQKLFPDTLPRRGEIEVHVSGARDEGVNGVIGNTLAYICGVNDESGFKGIGPKFDRSNKLFFSKGFSSQVRLKRIDTQKHIDLSYDPSIVPPHPQMKELMQTVLMGKGGIEERKKFQTLWQERVAKILLNKELWSQLVQIH